MRFEEGERMQGGAQSLEFMGFGGEILSSPD